MNEVLFEIPIYLRSPEKYEAERLLKEKKFKESHSKHPKIENLEIKWPPWEYNDIIGYFKIIVNPSLNAGGNINGIQVEKYFCDSKRIRRDPNRRRMQIILDDPWYHKKLSIQNSGEFDLRNSLLKIIDSLSDDLARARNEKKRYFIDKNYYKNLINCLQFEELIPAYFGMVD